MTRKTALVALLLVGLACLTVEVNRKKHSVAPNTITEFSTLSNPDAGSDTASIAEDLCADDCSILDAGYSWAEENAIANEKACDEEGKRSDSASFAEGCKQYVHAMRPED